jgi:hypothetical protein
MDMKTAEIITEIARTNGALNLPPRYPKNGCNQEEVMESIVNSSPDKVMDKPRFFVMAGIKPGKIFP